MTAHAFAEEAHVFDDERPIPMQVTDPVCGTRFEIDQAAAQEDHGGWAYFFCSAQCHRLFAADPDGYLGREQLFSQRRPDGAR